MALFSSNAQSQSSNLVEFMAGKMFMREKVVHPDPRKGKVFLFQSEDGLMHFCWKDVTTGTVEDDLIIFPDDAKFARVNQCTTGRVYLLSFKSPPRKMLFWMQSYKDDKDEEHCKRVNDLLNNPPTPGANTRARGGGQSGLDQLNVVNQLLSSAGSGGGEDLQRAFQGVDRHQMMQLLNLMGGGSGAGLTDLFGGADQGSAGSASHTVRRTPTSSLPPTTISRSGSRPVAAAGATAATTAASGGATAGQAAGQPSRPITTAELSHILSGINSGAASQVMDVDLESVLTAKNVEPVLTKNVDRLIKHLPEEPPVEANQKELVATLHSPQFRQAVGTFNVALRSGQLGPVMQQFGFSNDVIKAFAKGDAQSVAEMLEQEAAKKQSVEPSSADASGRSEDGKGSATDKKDDGKHDDKGKKDDDPMDLD